jgi:hypothetical protein
MLTTGALGCIFLLVGIAAEEKAASFGLALIFLSLALLCWRHGSRLGTDAAFLGGSVFLFIFAAIFFAVWLQSVTYDPRAPVATETPQRPVGKLTPLQGAGIPKAPVGKLTPVPCGKRDEVPGFISDEKTCADSDTEPYGLKGTREAKRLQRPSPRDPILAAINGSKSDNTNSSVVGSTTISTLPEQATKLATRTWRNLRDGQSYRTHSKGGVLYLESVDDYLKRVGDIVSCEFNPAVSPGLNWTGFCWERNPKDQSTYRSTATLAIFSDTRIEGATSYIPKFVMIPLESAPNGVSNSTINTENQTPAPPARVVPLPQETGSSQSGRSRQQLDVSSLSGPELQSIESACLLPKMNQGPAAYNQCLQDQLAKLATAPPRPDLSSLSGPEQQSIESACLLPKMNQRAGSIQSMSPK